MPFISEPPPLRPFAISSTPPANALGLKADFISPIAFADIPFNPPASDIAPLIALGAPLIAVGTPFAPSAIDVIPLLTVFLPKLANPFNPSSA